MELTMSANEYNGPSAIALDLTKLLGFRGIAVAAGGQGGLARTLGIACNKVGEASAKHQVDTSGIPLDRPVE
jgi:hypothetical protein